MGDSEKMDCFKEKRTKNQTTKQTPNPLKRQRIQMNDEYSSEDEDMYQNDAESIQTKRTLSSSIMTSRGNRNNLKTRWSEEQLQKDDVSSDSDEIYQNNVSQTASHINENERTVEGCTETSLNVLI